jgi:hypothetical protein
VKQLQLLISMKYGKQLKKPAQQGF